MAGAQIIRIGRIDTAQRPACVYHRAERGAGVRQQRGEATLHPDIEIRAAGAPRIERIHRWQARIENLLEIARRGGTEFGQGNASAVGKIDQQLPLSARIVQGHDATFTWRMRLCKHDQCSGQFVHVVDALHPVTIEYCLVRGIRTGQRTGVGQRHPGAELGAANLENDQRNAARIGFFETGDELRRLARGFEKQADHAGGRLIQHIIQVVLDADHQFLPGGGGETEGDALFAIEYRGHARAGLAEQHHVAIAVVVAGVEAAGPHTIAEVVKAHAVAAGQQQSGLQGARADTLAEHRCGVVLEQQRGVDHCSSRSVPDGLLERGFDAGVGNREDHQFRARGQFVERGVAGHIQHPVVARIDRVDATGVLAPAQVAQNLVAHRGRPGAGAIDRDGSRPDQRAQTMLHGRVLAQQEGAGVMRRRSGSNTGSVITRHVAISLVHFSSRL